MIRFETGTVTVILDHAASAYPEECCGVMVGREEPDGARTVVRVTRAENRREDERERRFLIPPDAVREAEEAAREDGLDVLGFYHSHPDHPPRPSDFDREHAWPWYSYVIIDVARGTPGVLRSWRLRDDRSGFDEETVA